MTWSTLPVYSDGTTLTAAMLEAIKANINETAPAKATTAGYHFVSNGSNTIVERAIVADEQLSQQTTTSTSYANLATTGPTVTATTGNQALVSLSCQMFNSGSASSCWSTFELSGATTVAANDQRAIAIDGVPANNAFKLGATFLPGLNTGSNTFQLKYRVGSNTGTFDDRHLVVMAL